MQVLFGYFCVLNKKMIRQLHAAANEVSMVDLAPLDGSGAGRAVSLLHGVPAPWSLSWWQPPPAAICYNHSWLLALHMFVSLDAGA